MKAFKANKELRERFNELSSKDAIFITLEELEANLDRTISKYKNQGS